jgi:hypothetical protein
VAKQREPEQPDPGKLFGALAERLVQACTQTHTEVREDECLRADQDDGDPEREVKQADREADRKLVEADREPEHHASPRPRASFRSRSRSA